MNNLKQLQKIESKARILNVAARLFKTKGYSAVGIDLIMAEAGLTAGAFYAHFKSKTDLLSQTIEHSLSQSKLALFKGLEHLPESDKIKLVMHRYMSIGHRDWPEKGCILPALASEIYRESDGVNLIIEKYITEWANFFVINWIDDELSDLQKKEKALGLISQAVGAILISRMLKNTKLADEIINTRPLS